MSTLNYRHPDNKTQILSQADMLAIPYRNSHGMHPRGHGRFVVAHPSLGKMPGCLIDTWFCREVDAEESIAAEKLRLQDAEKRRYAELRRGLPARLPVTDDRVVQHSDAGW